MLDKFAKLLGIAPRHAEDALHSERAARAVLSRRSLVAAAGAMATGAIFSFGTVEAPGIDLVAGTISGSTLTSFNELLKERYIDSAVLDSLLWVDSPFLSILERAPILVHPPSELS